MVTSESRICSSLGFGAVPYLNVNTCIEMSLKISKSPRGLSNDLLNDLCKTCKTRFTLFFKKYVSNYVNISKFIYLSL